MTDKDKMIRKMWLLSYIIISIGEFIFRYSQQISPELIAFDVVSLIFSGIGAFLIVYMYYRCAYKKPGTKLLTFSLVVFPIIVALKILLVVRGNVNLAQSGLHPLQMILAIWFYVLTWKMRKINKKLQAA